MGSISMLLLLDLDDVRARVVPALRAWIAGGEPVAWWDSALDVASAPGPDPADRAAWPAAGRPGPDLPGPVVMPMPSRRVNERTGRALEVALTSATVDDGLAVGNARSLVLDLRTEDGPVLDPPPEARSRLAALLRDLDSNLMPVNHGGGGFGEGLRGVLDEAAVAALDDELAAHGSRPNAGTVRDIRDALDRRGPAGGQARATLIAVHGMARLASRRRLGLLHGRDLSVEGLGAWHAGLLRRDGLA